MYVQKRAFIQLDFSLMGKNLEKPRFSSSYALEAYTSKLFFNDRYET